jgi:hypothetical protein
VEIYQKNEVYFGTEVPFCTHVEYKLLSSEDFAEERALEIDSPFVGGGIKKNF